jgi:hypothetical protein
VGDPAVNWSAIAALAELLGAAAVVVSLFYLAAEVRKSRMQARLDASRELATRITQASIAAASSRDLAEVFHAGSGGMERLDPVDQTRYRAFMNALFRGFEQQFLLWRAGTLDEEMWESVVEIVRDFASLPGVQTYLRDRRGWYVRSFVDFVEQVADVDLSKGTRMVDQYVGSGEDPREPGTLT